MSRPSPETVLVLGATSSIAHATSRLFAKEGARFCLAARDAGKLAAAARDLAVLGAAGVETIQGDLADPSRHRSLVDKAFGTLGRVDIVLIAYGILGDQERAQEDAAAAETILRVDFLSVVSLLTELASRMERQKSGRIVVISSVAGDRGRQSNYVYGSAKGGLNVFLQGLRNRLFRSGVGVLTVKPGLVDTPMTASLAKNPLYASPESVGRGIFKAIRRGKDEVYLPFFWRWIMAVVRAVPESLFKRMRF